MEEAPLITLVLADNEKFFVPRKIAEASSIIATVLADLGDDVREIPLPEVQENVFRWIYEYLNQHKDDPPKPAEDNKQRDAAIEPWDTKFCQRMDKDMLFDVLLTANYLDISELKKLCCRFIGLMIKGKTPQEIRDLFGIENDFSPEEEAEVNAENKWYDETCFNPE